MIAHISATAAPSWSAENKKRTKGEDRFLSRLAFYGENAKSKTANMVRLWRPESSKMTANSFRTFTGEEEADVTKFFFVFENVFTKDKTSSERAHVIFRHLEGPAFEF